MANLWPRGDYMRLRDAIKSADRCELEGIASQDYENNEPVIVKDGGDGEDISPFMRETRRRLNRTEDRLAIMVKLQLLILGGFMSALVALFVFVLDALV